MAIADAPPKTPLALDTDVFTDWRVQRPHVKRAIQDYHNRLNCFPGLTAMTIFEVRYGFERRVIKSGILDDQTKSDHSQTEQLIQVCRLLNVEQEAAILAAQIFARLSRGDRNKHWRDVFIAATAMAHGHGVATRNKDDFELIGQHLPADAPTLYLAIWKP